MMPIYILVIRNMRDWTWGYNYYQLIRVIQADITDAEMILTDISTKMNNSQALWHVETMILQRNDDTFLREQAVDYTDPKEWDV